MKIQKIFTIDQDIVDKLQDIENKSALVNDLLVKYFNLMPTRQTAEELLQTQQTLQNQLNSINQALDSSQKAIEEKKAREAIQADLDKQAFEEEKLRLKVKHALTKRYETITPRDQQSREGLDKFLIDNGYEPAIPEKEELLIKENESQ